MMKYHAKLTGEDFCAACVYISLPYNMAARTAGVDSNEEITPRSRYV